MKYEPKVIEKICFSDKYYTLRTGASFNKASLIAILKQNIETYKIPLIYQQADHIQRTFNGKLNRKYYRSL